MNRSINNWPTTLTPMHISSPSATSLLSPTTEEPSRSFPEIFVGDGVNDRIDDGVQVDELPQDRGPAYRTTTHDEPVLRDSERKKPEGHTFNFHLMIRIWIFNYTIKAGSRRAEKVVRC